MLMVPCIFVRSYMVQIKSFLLLYKVNDRVSIKRRHLDLTLTLIQRKGQHCVSC